MKLTDKEMEIMSVMWSSDVPLTATEIVEASSNRTWKENSIYIIMNTLIKKGAVSLSHRKPTATNTARAYKPTITAEEYAVRYIASVIDSGVRIDVRELIEQLQAKG